MNEIFEKFNRFHSIVFTIIFIIFSISTNVARENSKTSFVQSTASGHVIHTAIALSKGEGLANKKFKQENLNMLTRSKEASNLIFRPDMYSIGLDGQFYPKHPILISILAVPFYLIGGEIGVWVLSQIILFFLFLAILVFSKQYSSSTIAFFLGIFAMIYSELILIHCAGLSWDLLGAALISWAFIFKKWKYRILPYLMLALSCYLRMTHLFFLPFLLIFPWTGKIKVSFYDLIKFFLFLAPHLIFQWYIWGSPLTGPYSNLPHYVKGEMYIISGLKDHKFSLVTLLNGFEERLFFGEHAILKKIPTLLILPFLAFFTFRRKKLINDISILWLASFGYLLLFLSYHYWEGAYGFRFVYPSYVLCFVILASSLQTYISKFNE